MIDFTGICKSYGKQDIFDNVSFRINPGERVGIVGPNGMGKTTMFQILTGEISPDKGETVIPKKARLGYLRQQLDFYDPEAKLIDFVCAEEGELARIVEQIHALVRVQREGAQGSGCIPRQGSGQGCPELTEMEAWQAARPCCQGNLHLPGYFQVEVNKFLVRERVLARKWQYLQST